MQASARRSRSVPCSSSSRPCCWAGSGSTALVWPAPKTLHPNPAEKRAWAGPFLVLGSSLLSMFTGIVSERARVASSDGGRLVVETAIRAEIGDSVAIDGVCLTVTGARDGQLAFDVMVETLRRAKPFGREVNLEAALRAGDPLGGHYVQGHVDAIGAVRAVEQEGDGRRVWFDVPADVLRYLVEKGSITVDGVSLTVAELDDDGFAVAL